MSNKIKETKLVLLLNPDVPVPNTHAWDRIVDFAYHPKEDRVAILKSFRDRHPNARFVRMTLEATVTTEEL